MTGILAGVHNYRARMVNGTSRLAIETPQVTYITQIAMVIH